jgi:hypothetical protein
METRKALMVTAASKHSQARRELFERIIDARLTIRHSIEIVEDMERLIDESRRLTQRSRALRESIKKN